MHARNARDETDQAPAFEQGPLPAWYMRRRMKEEMDRASSYGRPLSIAILTAQRPLGEPADLRALQTAGAIALRAARATDLVGWLGPDSLLIIMPETTEDQAWLAQGRLIESLNAAGDAHTDWRTMVFECLSAGERAKDERPNAAQGCRCGRADVVPIQLLSS